MSDTPQQPTSDGDVSIRIHLTHRPASDSRWQRLSHCLEQMVDRPRYRVAAFLGKDPRGIIAYMVREITQVVGPLGVPQLSSISPQLSVKADMADRADARRPRGGVKR